MSLRKSWRHTSGPVVAIGVAVLLSAQFAVASRVGLLPFDASFAAGRDGEWLTLLATVAGLSTVTSALGGLVASDLVRTGRLARLVAVSVSAAGGLATLPYLRGLAGRARDVALAVGGPASSVTSALVVGLVLGALAAFVAGPYRPRPVAAGLALTIVGLWVLAGIATKVAVGVPPLGLVDDVYHGVAPPRLAVTALAWAAIGAVATLGAGRFTAARPVTLWAGVTGAVLVAISYATARPDGTYLDHTTIESGLLTFAIAVVGGALAGSALAALVSGRFRASTRPGS